MTTDAMVLVVGENPERVRKWMDWLERSGYSVLSCQGPTLTPCPRLGASRCALREIADAAVVEVQAPNEPYPYGEAWHERACTRLPDDGSTIFVGDAGAADLLHPVEPAVLIESVGRILRGRSVRPHT